MNPLAMLAAILPTILSYIPNPEERARVQAEAMARAVELEQQVINNQSEITKIEAQSEDPFKSYPRPAALWCCVFGVAYSTAYPILVWFSTITGIPVPPAVDDTSSTILLTSLLGLGGLRTVEKVTGKAPEQTIKTTKVNR